MRLADIKDNTSQFFWIAGAWVIVAFLISILSLLAYNEGKASYGWPYYFLFELMCIIPWPLFTPLIIRLFRTYDFSKTNRVQSFFMHLGMASVAFSVHTLVQSSTVFWFFEEPFNASYLKVDFIGFLDMRIAFYAGIILVVSAIDYYKKDRESGLREPQLRAALHRIKFQDLKNQLQPLFLLDTLDVVAQNLEKRPDFAEELIADLSELLRVMLESSKTEEVLLLKDVEYLKLYLDVLNKKTGTSITLDRDIDPGCYNALVPTIFYIVPLFEAVHRKGNETDGGLDNIVYGAECNAGRLRLSAVLSGVKISVDQLYEIQQQTGYHEIIDRLDQIYSTSYTLSCTRVGEGLKIVLEFPLRLATEEEHWAGNIFQSHE